MTTNKMTNKTALNFVIENCEIPAEVKEKIESMIKALDKKSANRSDKPTKTQEANAELTAEILSGDFRKGTVSDFIKNVPCLTDLSNQKVSRLLNDLVKADKATKATEKGKTIFTLA